MSALTFSIFLVFLAFCYSYRHLWTNVRVLAFQLYLTHGLALNHILTFVIVWIYYYDDKNVGISPGKRLSLKSALFAKIFIRKTEQTKTTKKGENCHCFCLCWIFWGFVVYFVYWHYSIENNHNIISVYNHCIAQWKRIDPSPLAIYFSLCMAW